MKTLSLCLTLWLTLALVGCGGGGGGQRDGSLPTTTVERDGTVAANLSASDLVFDPDVDPGCGDFSHVDFYQVTLLESGTLVVEMRSGVFDAFLAILHTSYVQAGADRDDPGHLVAWNDDRDATTTDSAVTVFLEAGSYVIAANSFEPFVTGDYTLVCSFQPVAQPPCLATEILPTDAGGGFGIGNVAFEATGCQASALNPLLFGLAAEHYYHLYEVTFTAPTNYTIAVTSVEIDPYIMLLDASFLANPMEFRPNDATLPYVIAVNDDESATVRDSRLEIQVQPGTYILYVGAWDGELGAYDLATTYQPL